METQKPNFTASAESQAITKLLASATVGQLLTYDQILKVTGETNLEEIRGFMMTARRSLQREKNIVFSPVTGIGLKRLDHSEIVGASRAKMDHVRRTTRRASETLACAELDGLTKDQRNEALALQAQMGAIQLAASLSSSRLIEQKVIQGQTLEIGSVTALFKSI